MDVVDIHAHSAVYLCILYFYVFYIKLLNSLSLLYADGMFISINILVAYGP